MTLGLTRRALAPGGLAAGTLLALLAPACRLPAQAPGPHPMMNHAPVWSPTRNLIAFDSDREGVSAVFVIDPDEGSVVRLGDGRLPACCVRWTPDGGHVEFEVHSAGRSETLRASVDPTAPPVRADSIEDGPARAALSLSVMAEDGYSVVVLHTPEGSRLQLTRGSWASQPSFSPDGRRIVYEDRDGDDISASRIVVMRRDGTGRRALARGTDPSWSPDGTRILFKTPTSAAGGFGWRVAIGEPDNSVVGSLAPGVHPSWSPDGSRISFMAETSQHRTDVWVMDADGGELRCLTCSH